MELYENDDAGWKVFRDSEELKFFYGEYIQWVTYIYDPNTTTEPEPEPVKPTPTPTTDTTPTPAPVTAEDYSKNLGQQCKNQNSCKVGIKCAVWYYLGTYTTTSCVKETDCGKDDKTFKIDCFGYVHPS
jgi:hypothetical protein